MVGQGIEDVSALLQLVAARSPLLSPHLLLRRDEEVPPPPQPRRLDRKGDLLLKEKTKARQVVTRRYTSIIQFFSSDEFELVCNQIYTLCSNITLDLYCQILPILYKVK